MPRRARSGPSSGAGALSAEQLAALERALDRPPPRYMPRAVRIGIDYALRVAHDTVDADTFVAFCIDEGRRQKADPCRRTGGS